MKVVQSIETAASPEILWPLITKRDNIVKWHPNAKTFDFIGEKQSGVGASFYMFGESAGRLMRSVSEITEWQENKRFAFKEVWGMTKSFTAAYSIEATEKGSKLTIAWDTEMPYGILGKIMLKLYRKQWLEQTDKMLANIKKLAET